MNLCIACFYAHVQCGELLLLEHEPVYTFGLRQKDFEVQSEQLRQLGADVVKVDSYQNLIMLYSIVRVHDLRMHSTQSIDAFDDTLTVGFIPGSSWRFDNISRSRPARLLSRAQSQFAKGRVAIIIHIP